METALQEKIEFFNQLKALQDEDDDLGCEEASHREKCKAFTKASLSTYASQARSNIPRPRRVASDPIPMTKVNESAPIIIEDTPEPRKRVPELRRAVSDQKGDTPVPETVRPGKPSTRRTTHPLFRSISLRSSSDGEQHSPTMMTNKRKRDTLKLVPEAQQWFKGLSFFYIPNNDISQLRRARITKAREYGATWTQNLEESSHIIVDKQLTYKDITNILKGSPGYTDKILVNENYPIDCITYHALVNPDQGQYKVSGIPSNAPPEPTSEVPHQSQVSDQSLQLKAPHNNPLRWDHVPPRSTQQSGDSSQKSSGLMAPNVIPSSLQEEGPIFPESSAHSEDQNDGPGNQPQPETPQPGTNNPVETPSDELAECIELVMEKFKDMPVSLVDDDEDDETSSVAPTDDLDDGSDDEGGSSEEERYRKKQRAKKSRPKSRQNDVNWQDKFSCMNGGTKDDAPNGPNARTIVVLQEMCEWYSRTNDHWRFFAYRKAITTLRGLDWKVTTQEEAVDLPHIGDRLAQKIEEIVQTNRLRRLEYAKDDPMSEVLDLFLNIYDVGLSRANKWIAHGFRTLEDLKEKAKLTTNQQVGIDHYDDLNMRIPRREVTALATCVKKAAAAIDPSIELVVGGSYRRGSETSGDVDFIFTKAGTSSSDDLVPFLDQLVRKLGSEGFLSVTLTSLQHNAGKGHGSKWHGCCVLPEKDFPGDKTDYRPIWRRVDFLLVPESEFGAALIYFTGNDIFNRSLRLLASKKGMRLNQRGLYKDLVRGLSRIKLTGGDLLEGRDEKKIFEILGVKWREPQHRWC